MNQDLNSIRIYISTELYSKYLMASYPDCDRNIIAQTAVEDADCLINKLLK